MQLNLITKSLECTSLRTWQQATAMRLRLQCHRPWDNPLYHNINLLSYIQIMEMQQELEQRLAECQTLTSPRNLQLATQGFQALWLKHLRLVNQFSKWQALQLTLFPQLEEYLPTTGYLE